ncbi:MAG: peptidyl-prolyl cis-trans isomerase [Pseudomonadota bacterium]
MLTLFRNLLFSRVGIVITFLVLGVIGLAFALGDSTGLRQAAGGAKDGPVLVTVGSKTITAGEIRADIKRIMEANPGISVEQIFAQGGFEQTLEGKINGLAAEEFASGQGLRIGKNLIGSEIATNPNFKGLDGKFDPVIYRDFLSKRGMTEADVDSLVSRGMTMAMLFGPVTPEALGKTPVPALIATPYASMLLERRTGTVAFIPATAVPAGAPISDAEAQAYYTRNIARFTVPERRSVRYAVITLDDMKARAVPTEDEIAKAYKDQAAKFAATEHRTVSQVVLLDQKSGDAFAAKVRGGTPIADAAKALGLDASVTADTNKADYAGQTSAAIANQVFTAANGAVIGPVKTALGWTVIHVDKITQVAAKSLDQARPELVKSLGEQKLPVVATTLREQLAEAIDNNIPLDQIATKFKLTLQTSAPLDAQGLDPDSKTPPAQPDPTVAAVTAYGFQTTPQDAPQMIPIGKDGSFAVVALAKVVPAAPRPLASVTDQVKKEVLLDRQLRQARVFAQAVVDKVNKKVSLSQALSETGLNLPQMQAVSHTRKELLNMKPPTPPLILLFRMPVGTAKMLQAPNQAGWFVVTNNLIIPGNAKGNDTEINAQRAFIAGSVSNELGQQYGRAIRLQVGVKRNEEAINALRAELLGQNGAAGQ